VAGGSKRNPFCRDSGIGDFGKIGGYKLGDIDQNIRGRGLSRKGVNRHSALLLKFEADLKPVTSMITKSDFQKTLPGCFPSGVRRRSRLRG
jgi:hypothetical protein